MRKLRLSEAALIESGPVVLGDNQRWQEEQHHDHRGLVMDFTLYLHL